MASIYKQQLPIQDSTYSDEDHNSGIDHDNNRYSIRVEFEKRIKFGFPRANISGFTFDLSLNGVGINSYRSLPPGSIILMNIYTGDQTHSLEGEIMWVQKVKPGAFIQMGVKFLSRTDKISQIYERELLMTLTDLHNEEDELYPQAS